MNNKSALAIIIVGVAGAILSLAMRPELVVVLLVMSHLFIGGFAIIVNFKRGAK